jgi:hypothetical protein
MRKHIGAGRLDELDVHQSWFESLGSNHEPRAGDGALPTGAGRIKRSPTAAVELISLHLSGESCNQFRE